MYIMNLKDVGTRIRHYRAQKGLSQSELANRVNIGQSAIYKIENGFSNTSISKLIDIAKALGISTYELLSEKPLVPYKSTKPKLEFNQPKGDFEGIKLFEDTISLGPGHEINELPPKDYIPLSKKLLPKGYKSDPDRIVAFETEGISMKPTINDGSIIWIDRMDVIPKEGEIYAFLLKDLSNSVTIKRLTKIDRHFFIIDGDNKNLEDRKSEDLKDFPMVLNLKEYEEEDISPVCGRVIWILNRMIEKKNKKLMGV